MKKTNIQKVSTLLWIGQMLSNVAYNASHDSELPQHYRELLKDLQNQWDNEKQRLRNVEGLKI